MRNTDISSTYYQSQIDRVDSDIRSFDEIIRDAQERKRAAIELREILISQLGLDSVNPPRAFLDLSVREAVRQCLLDSVVGLMPKDIAQYMKAKGYDYTGSTIINTRISNELLNLMKTELVTKVDGLYYASEGGAT